MLITLSIRYPARFLATFLDPGRQLTFARFAFGVASITFAPFG